MVDVKYSYKIITLFFLDFFSFFLFYFFRKNNFTINVMPRYKLINAIINLAYELTDVKRYKNIHEQHKFRLESVNENEELSPDEKKVAMKVLLQIYDSDKVLFKSGEKRNC